jgi:hypothetical protein
MTHHDNLYVDYFDLKRIYEFIIRKYQWNNAYADIKKYIKICDSYQKNKIPKYKLYKEFHPIPISDAFFKIIIIDFITDLSSNMRESYTKAYNAILIAICKFIKFAIYIPTRKDIDTAELTNLLLGHIIEIYRYP